MAYDYVVLTPNDRLALVRETLRTLEQEQQRVEINPAAVGSDSTLPERLASVRKLYDDLSKEVAKS